MSLRLVRELAADGIPVAVTCRVLGLPRSTFYEATGRAPSARAVEDVRLTALIAEVHADSRGTYGAPRVHAELRLGLGLAVGRKRVARLMRDARIQGDALIESFWSSMQRELLDRRDWTSRVELASAMFEWIEGFYNPRRRHSSLGMLSQHEFETRHATAVPAAWSTNRTCPESRVRLPSALLTSGQQSVTPRTPRVGDRKSMAGETLSAETGKAGGFHDGLRAGGPSSERRRSPAMRLNKFAVWAMAATAVAAVLIPQEATAAKKLPGLTMSDYSVTVSQTNDEVLDWCTSWHGYPQCGDVVVHVTIAGFAQYLGLDSMEALGNDGYELGHPWWGGVQGTAQASGTVVCATTGVSYKFSQAVNLTPMWGDEQLSFLNTFTRISNDAATFTLEGGFDPRSSLPKGACPPSTPEAVVGALRYTSAKVGNIVITWTSVPSRRPEYPTTATVTIPGKFPGPIA